MILDRYQIQERLASGELRHVSPSSLGDADVCMKRLLYRWDPDIPKGTSEAALVGKGYHAGLEVLYICRRDGLFEAGAGDIEGAALRSFTEEAAKFDRWDTSKAEARARMTGLLASYQQLGCAWPEDTWEVIGVEQEVLVPLVGRWAMKMIIDLVVRNRSTGGLVVVDHKTAKRRWPKDKEHPRKNLQAVLYPWALWMSTGELPDAVCFDVMTTGGVFERRWSHPTEHHFRAMLDKALGITTIIDSVPMSALPANPTSNLCSSQYCDFWQVCPFGESAVSVSVRPSASSDPIANLQNHEEKS